MRPILVILSQLATVARHLLWFFPFIQAYYRNTYMLDRI
jgi:hypothetical protein